MNRLRKLLAAATKSLGIQQKLLARAQHRYKANRKRAYIAENQKEKAERLADQRRAKGLTKAAASYDKQARQHAHVAYRNHLRAQHYLGVTKTLQQRINKLDTSAAAYEKKIKANKAKVGPDGHKITGGTARQRLRLAIHTAAHNCAVGLQRNYYSETGGVRDYLHVLADYALGRIWDCSTFGDGVYLVCDLEAPSGPNTLTAGGYTGTQGEHGKRVSRAQAKTGDLVLYGPAPHHHVELVDDPKAETTIGHGSPPIDAGVFDLFGGGSCATVDGPGPQSLADYEIRSYL